MRRSPRTRDDIETLRGGLRCSTLGTKGINPPSRIQRGGILDQALSGATHASVQRRHRAVVPDPLGDMLIVAQG